MSESFVFLDHPSASPSGFSRKWSFWSFLLMVFCPWRTTSKTSRQPLTLRSPTNLVEMRYIIHYLARGWGCYSDLPRECKEQLRAEPQKNSQWMHWDVLFSWLLSIMFHPLSISSVGKVSCIQETVCVPRNISMFLL